MNILLLGSGGREHAIGWKVSKSPKVDNLIHSTRKCRNISHRQKYSLSPNDFDSIRNLSLKTK